MQPETLTTEEQIADLAARLKSATGHRRTVVRPDVAIGYEVRAGGEMVARYGPGPVTVVTFYISEPLADG